MLVLGRKAGERIVIDGGITITLVRIDRNKVRLGVEAPRGVKVYREELLPLRPAGPGAVSLDPDEE